MAESVSTTNPDDVKLDVSINTADISTFPYRFSPIICTTHTKKGRDRDYEHMLLLVTTSQNVDETIRKLGTIKEYVSHKNMGKIGEIQLESFINIASKFGITVEFIESFKSNHIHP